MPEKVVCNLCGLKNSVDLFRKEYLKIIKCINCGLIYTSPRLTRKEATRLYSSFNTKVDKKTLYSLETNARKRLSGVMKFKESGSLLEVGCSLGYFLNEAKEKGFEVTGLELSRNAASIGKKLYGIREIYSVRIEDFSPKSTFDVVAMYHTLEHLPDPRKALVVIRKIMNRGGILVIEVPDVGSFKAKLLKEKWVAYDFYLHYYYFSYKTLQKLLEECGFKIIRKENIPSAILEGTAASTKIKRMPSKMKNMLGLPYSYIIFTMGKIKIGDAIRVYAVKK